MTKATLHGIVIAESDATIVVENNHYFPPDSIDWSKLEASDTRSHCPWKGDASYYTVSVPGDARADAAWTYPQPKEAAAQIKDYVAFWRGVQVEP